MTDRIRRLLPLLIAVAALGVALGIMVAQSTRATSGHYIYTLDDAYIHMAMAKNMAEHGTWGVNAGEYSNSSSSPLWTLMLSGVFALTGVHEITPLIINIVIAVLLLIAAFRLIASYRMPGWLAAIVLVFMAHVTPLVALVSTGLEHVSHLLISVVFLSSALSSLCEKEGRAEGAWSYYVTAAMLTMIRFEGMFLLLAVTLLVWLKGLRRQALIGLAAGLAPIIIGGVIGLAHGWSCFPNSVLVKGEASRLSADLFGSGVPTYERASALLRFVFHGPYQKLLENPPLIALLVAGLASYLWRSWLGRSVWERGQVLLAAFIMTTVLHLIPAHLGWFYRYEGYLIGLGVLALARPLQEFVTARLLSRPLNWGESARWIAVIILAVLAVRPLASRGGRSFDSVPKAARNIYEQQYQMGRFVATYYHDQTIAANDIGAICFLSDAYCLDLVGLTSREVYEARRSGPLTREQISALADSRNVRIAIVYDQWFAGSIPIAWQRAGTWRIQNNIVCGSDTVSFYGVTPDAAERLRHNLARFGDSLPQGVIQSGSADPPRDRSQ